MKRITTKRLPPLRLPGEWYGADLPPAPEGLTALEEELTSALGDAQELCDRARWSYRVNRVWSVVLAILSAWHLCETGGVLAGLALVLIAVLWWTAADAKRSAK